MILQRETYHNISDCLGRVCDDVIIYDDCSYNNATEFSQLSFPTEDSAIVLDGCFVRGVIPVVSYGLVGVPISLWICITMYPLM